MKKATSGFTVVEIVTIIVVIGILATIGVVSYSTVQTKVRDSQRVNQISIIQDALEKYYSKNGEYPSCESISQSSTVALGSIDTKVLIAPKATTNSIKCDNTNPSTNNDVFRYTGTSDTSCLPSQPCLQWKIDYIEESTNTVKTIESKNRLPSLDAVVAQATAGVSQSINITWNLVTNATNYSIEYTTDSSFTSPASASTSNTSIALTGLNAGAQYYLRVKPTAPYYIGNWSSTVSSITDINQPATPTVSTATTGANTTFSWNTATCQAGTVPTYQWQYQTSAGYTSAWTASASTNAIFSTSTEGVSYTLYVQSKCYNSNTSSTWSTSGSGYYYRSWSPPVLAISATPSSILAGQNITVTTTSNINVGPTPYYLKIYDQTEAAYKVSAGSGTSLSFTTSLTANHTYIGRATDYSGNTIYSYSSPITVSVTPINTPASPTVSVSTSGSTSTFSWNAISCQSGTTTSYQWRYYNDNSYDSGWNAMSYSGPVAVTTSSEGYTYTVQVQAKCSATGVSSAWSGTGQASYFRPMSNPGPITYSISRVNSYTVSISATSSCSSGMYLDSQSDVYSANYTWYQNLGTGWYASRHSNVWLNSDWGWYGNPVTISPSQQNTSNSYSVGSIWGIKVNLRCHNYTTGAVSGTVYGETTSLSAP